jgi:hypothetical protein
LLAPHRLLSIWSLPEVVAAVEQKQILAEAVVEVQAVCFKRHHLLLLLVLR